MGVKVGDRIRLLCDDDCDAYERGDIVMVSEVDDDGVYFNDNDDDRRYLVFEDFEPVAVADCNDNQHGYQPKFKVGDRVRCVDDTGTKLVAEGQVYTIEGIKDEFITVRGKNMFSHRFELVDAPLAIQAGRYYRTRDGRKVGPAKDMGHYFNLNCWDYNAAGKCGFEGRDNDEDYRRKHDIIAEWTDEPTVTPTSTTGFTVPLDAPEFGGAEGKFKVGDEVEHINLKETGTGFITSINDDGTVGVHWNSWYGDCTDPVDVLRLVAKATSGKNTINRIPWMQQAENNVATIADIVRRLEALENATNDTHVRIGDKVTLRATVTGKQKKTRINITLDDVSGASHSLVVPAAALTLAS